jgi:hypothetical protein
MLHLYFIWYDEIIFFFLKIKKNKKTTLVIARVIVMPKQLLMLSQWNQPSILIKM